MMFCDLWKAFDISREITPNISIVPFINSDIEKQRK